jgi:hypothetical protein
MLYTPAAGPSRKIPIAPGRDRSLWDPSKTTTMSRGNRIRPACRPASASRRAAMIAASSAIRAATVSASVPNSTAQFCPSGV